MHIHLIIIYDWFFVDSLDAFSYTIQGLCSLSGRTSYHKISWSFEARDSGLDFPIAVKNWQAPRPQRCRTACQISQRWDHYNMQSCGFETSRDLADVLENRFPGSQKLAPDG